MECHVARAGALSNAEDTDKHLRSLPLPLMKLAELSGMDDALIVLVEQNRSEKTLTLTMRCGDNRMGYYDLELRYSHPQLSSKDERQLARLARSTVNIHDFDADLSRHEINATEDGGLDHRIEFHVFNREDVWISIRCSALDWKTEVRNSRHLPDVQDTFYVGTLKGVGRIYQQTFIDTYTRVAAVKLYDRKNALVAAEMLNDRVLPLFEAQGVRLLRILTDRGSEYVGNLQHHEYELYLAIEDIDHTKTKARSPQTNGICERFHRTMLEEFYQIAFRKKVYVSLEALQADADEWLRFYNEERPHSGKYCYGKTPMETFQASKHLAQEKMLDRTNLQQIGQVDTNLAAVR